MKRHAEIREMINGELQESKANEYAAKYRAKEQEMEIERQTLQNRMMNYILLVMLIGMMIALFLYNHTVFQKKKLIEKNNALVKLIDEKSKPNSNDACLSEACRILREQRDMKISDVAKKVKLTPSALQKLFKEQYGITPTEYRNSHV